MALIIKISTVEVASIASFNFLNLVTATSKPTETKKIPQDFVRQSAWQLFQAEGIKKKHMIHDTTSLRIWRQYECHRSAVDQPSS